MTRRLPILLPIVTVLLAGTLWACSVPVFRYAFEQWQPDPYTAIVFHRGELTEDQQTLIDGLQPAGGEGAVAVNLDVTTIDLEDEPDVDMATLWKEQETETLPWVVLNGPAKQRPPATIWAGELTEPNAAQILTSPARQDIQERLLNGESVVWVFLGSGNQEADDAAYQTVQAESERLEQELELPEINEADLKDLTVDPAALKLKMSSLRVDRDDAAEQVLVEMLLRVEPDLLDEPFVSQPMVFPVFGRGRALYALVGDGITSGTIEEAGQFLTGACQCTVKAQNPGVDLLLSVDWDHYIQPVIPYDTTAPTLAGLSGFAEQDDTLADASGASASEPDTTSAGGLLDKPASNDASKSLASDEREESESDTGLSQQLASVPEPGHPVAVDQPLPTTEIGTPSVTRNVLILLGLLAACVVVITIVFIPRSR